MALGFGFNKAKVLASAEKYVQQGKLHHAISEYEKIVEKDPKDLTVLNTIGDLYARLGQNEKAGEFFKRVGDTYASEGFTVKSIAMYKKLTKLNPGNITVVQRLAELYTQQGLYNDARQQYLQLADASIKNNDLGAAIKVFQKMLEIDPDNVSLQTKLADLYLKMGKKDEARDIFMKSAQSLFDRGSVEQADQALDRMLALDPSNVEALLMRAKIALDAGDGAAAARYFEKVPDIDSRQEGLQSLLKAYILSNQGESAEGIARKLATVHNDLGGIRAYADFLLAAGNSEAAVNLYDEWVDRLIVGDTGELVFAIQGLSGQVKESTASLERLRGIFQKAGATANIPEINELLAHAYVQAGDFGKARDLYKELAELEPSNPQHMQNYRQVMAKMGEEPTARPLATNEGAQALFVEEIDAPALPVQQEYPAALMEKISNVLTDAELFESYNKPQQAVAPLEGVLAKAPKDVRINQRLISVYGRLGKLGEAAICCDTLKDVYYENNMASEARKYADMAIRFRGKAGLPTTVEVPPVVPAEAPAIETPAQELTATAFEVPMSEAEMPVMPVEPGEAHEIDLSAEWESALEVVEEMPVAAPEPAVEKAKEAEELEDISEIHPSVVADLLEEIKFYLAQGMFDEAKSAIARCERSAPASFELAELKQQLAAAESGTPVVPPEGAESVPAGEKTPALASDEAEGSVAEFDFAAATVETVDSVEESVPTFEVAAPVVEEVAFEEVAEEPKLEQPAPVQVEVTPPPMEKVTEAPVLAAAIEEVAVEPIIAMPEWATPPQPEFIETAAEAAPVEAVAEETTAVEEVIEEIADLPTVETAAQLPAAVAEPPLAPPITESEPVVEEIAAAPEKDVLADFVLDLEGALPAEFGEAAPQPAKAAAAAVAVTTPPPVAAPPVVPSPQGIPAIAASVPAPAAATPAPAPAASQVDLTTLTQEETSSVLSDLFAEFKEEVGEAQEEAEDPETHYNLGVAFKEMGLLDEAIGELQKVCKSIDKGTSFSQVMQAYTWLAGCFVEKGVPEASVKWYNKALTVAANEESRTALHYDLASAYEAAGERQQALKHFMEVYGTNIDYRDVAERIKTLKA
jgi:tetratricopeptide (TPR) repeat protein